MSYLGTQASFQDHSQSQLKGECRTKHLLGGKWEEEAEVCVLYWFIDTGWQYVP